MAVRPREKLVLTVELWDKRLKVSGYLYEGVELVSSTGVDVAMDAVAREYVRLADLMEEIYPLVQACRRVVAQPSLPL